MHLLSDVLPDIARVLSHLGSVPTDFTEHSRLMFDLMTLAMQTDQTRILTVLLGIEQSPRNYPEIGITEGHHGLTHHQGDKEKIEKVTQINEYHIKQFVYLLEKLKSTPDGDGTLLDNSMIMYGSGLADGSQHQHFNLPTVVAGRGRFRGQFPLTPSRPRSCTVTMVTSSWGLCTSGGTR